MIQLPNRKPSFFQYVTGRSDDNFAIPHLLNLVKIDPMLCKVGGAFFWIILEFHS